MLKERERKREREIERVKKGESESLWLCNDLRN